MAGCAATKSSRFSTARKPCSPSAWITSSLNTDRKRQNPAASSSFSSRTCRNVFVALSVESTPFFRRALLPLFQGLYPTVMLTFVAHRKMKRSLDTFKAEGDYTDLIITRASQRLRYQEGTQNKENHADSQLA